MEADFAPALVLYEPHAKRASALADLRARLVHGATRAMRLTMTPGLVFTVDEFCEAHRISRVTFYKLLKDGRGPKIMKLGASTRITAEAAAVWRRRMEKAAQKSA